MARGELWFRARRGDRGTGYSVAHWKGVLVSLAYVLTVTAGVTAALRIFPDPWAAAASIAAVVLVSTGVYLTVIRGHSDWKG
jgi:hypothetical protein